LRLPFEQRFTSSSFERWDAKTDASETKLTMAGTSKILKKAQIILHMLRIKATQVSSIRLSA